MESYYCIKLSIYYTCIISLITRTKPITQSRIIARIPAQESNTYLMRQTAVDDIESSRGYEPCPMMLVSEQDVKYNGNVKSSEGSIEDNQSASSLEETSSTTQLPQQTTTPPEPNTKVQCKCILKNILCKNLNKIPQFHYEENIDGIDSNGKNKRERWKGIYLPNQNISQIPEVAFLELRVKTIILNMNPIGNRIHTNAFTGLEDVLEEIQMGRCQIGRLPSKILRGLDNLKVFHLWDNQIEYIPNFFFKDTNMLQDVSLWGNRIDQINENTFAGLWQLTRLDLSRNLIPEFEALAFKHLTNLEILKLGGNKIQALLKGSFQYMPNLKALDISYNGLFSVYPGAFEQLSNLLLLDLHHNDIELFTENPFRNLYNLTALYLNHNRLEVIWPPTFASLYSLQTLNLGHNLLVKIPHYSFKHIEHLKELVLDYNQLRSLNKCVFYKKLQLQVLSLVGNQMKCDCKLSWVYSDMAQKGTRVWGTCKYSTLKEIHSVANKQNYVQNGCLKRKSKKHDCR